MFPELKNIKNRMLFMKEILTSKNWIDFKQKIKNLSPKEKGDAFELLVKYYLLLDPKYSSLLRNVWLYDEIPISIHKKLNLPEKDKGIDLIAETKEHQFWAIQCKYRDNEEENITWTEISTFVGLSFGVCKNISYSLLCASCEKITKVVDRIDNFGIRTIEVFHHLDKDFFERFKAFIKQKPTKLIPFRPKPHQQRAIKNAIKHFIKDGNQRGKLIMPCGTGKSLAAYWIADKLKAQKILIALPSLSLMSQTIDVWLRENIANKKEINWIAVCSDETVAEAEKDEIAVFVQDLGIPVETNVNEITNWLKTNQRKNIVVFTTYQSGMVIAEASSKAKIKYDFGIYDEAHKTVGRKYKLFSHLLFDENIQIQNRLFMTATERRYAGGKTDKILSMDDLDIYGDTFELLSFKEALEYDPPILSDYRIVTMVVEESEIEQLIKENIFVTSDKLKIEKEIEAEMLASAISLRKAMIKHPITHAVSFHRSIKRSKIFQLIQNSFSEVFPDYGDLATFHVDGKMTSGKRDRILNEFSSTQLSLISNARCLTEGIDVKNIDCVLFADPKKSRIDIVQAIGRALRPLEGKELGYIIVPIITTDGNFEHTAFDEILFLLRALATTDERIVEYFRAKFNNKRPTDNIINVDIDEKLALKIDTDQFIKSIETICWQSVAKLSWMPFEEARNIVYKQNLKTVNEWWQYCKSDEMPEDIPRAPDMTYKTNWVSWGDWLGTGTIATRLRNYRPYEEARDFVHKLNLKNENEWRQYRKSDEKPEDIPRAPDRTYKTKGWVSWGDWLGTGRVADQLKKYRQFEEARNFVHKLDLKNRDEWGQYCKRAEMPEDIPRAPDMTYKTNWVSWGDWLGTGTIATQLRNYRPYEEAKDFVHKLNLKNRDEWEQYCKTGKKPKDIPRAPRVKYKNEGWVSWGDWLGTGTIATQLRNYRPYEEAKDFVHKLNLKSADEWRRYCNSGKRPDDIPAAPYLTYNEKWINWADWLGKD